MTNEELKKKIKEILRKRMTELLGSCRTDEIPLAEEGVEAILFYADEFADALIAAGIGDVSEYKEKLKLHRVFVRKDGGDVKVLYGNKEVDEIVKEREEYKHRAEVTERALCNALNDDSCYFCNKKSPCECEHRDWGSKECITVLLRQAEKELAEERKDE